MSGDNEKPPQPEKPQSDLLFIPTAQDVKLYGDVSLTVGKCGQCKFFRLQEGQKAIKAQRFLDQLVHDAEWQVQHLGAPAETLGLCTQRDGSTLTAKSNPSCVHFKAGPNDSGDAL